ncbi:MAG: hypothetical protein O7A03_05145 [Alphaproteobacteria bacterium]|nr:hypothetical protein [Alphaproteobacteria bacterium]
MVTNPASSARGAGGAAAIADDVVDGEADGEADGVVNEVADEVAGEDVTEGVALRVVDPLLLDRDIRALLPLLPMLP